MIYTVHEPPPRRREIAAAPERFVFVRDGFYFWAFVFGPFWLLWRRLWLALLLYVVGVFALELGLRLLGASAFVQWGAAFLISLLIGLEAASLRRWTLARRGWKNLGVVTGATLEAAEQRFFDAWVARAPAQGVLPAMPTPSPKPGTSDVIGLFPEPQR